MDTGIQALVAIARFHQLPAEADQIKHEFAEPGQPISEQQLVCAARALSLKAKPKHLKLSQLSERGLPALLETPSVL